MIRRELVASGWQPPHKDAKDKPLKYPLKQVTGIIKKRLHYGSEWLLSEQWWTGLDNYGNDQSIAMNCKEMYDDIYPYMKSIPDP